SAPSGTRSARGRAAARPASVTGARTGECRSAVSRAQPRPDSVRKRRCADSDAAPARPLWPASDYSGAGTVMRLLSKEVVRISELRTRAADVEMNGRPSAVSFVTTEHFVLQSARAATIAESTGRATMFLASASGGLIALGLVATATRVGTAFYAFGLVLLPTL